MMATSEISEINTGYVADKLSVATEQSEQSSNVPPRYDQISHDGLLNDPTNPFVDQSEIEDVCSADEFGGHHLEKLTW
jgi:hypothetical protein